MTQAPERHANSSVDCNAADDKRRPVSQFAPVIIIVRSLHSVCVKVIGAEVLMVIPLLKGYGSCLVKVLNLQLQTVVCLTHNYSMLANLPSLLPACNDLCNISWGRR